MARSDKVAMCIMRYMVPLIFVVEFIAIAALAWSLGGPQWAFGAVAAVALMLLFSYAFCYIGLSVPGMLAVTFLFTALLTIYAVTVRALCLEYRKSGLAD